MDHARLVRSFVSGPDAFADLLAGRRIAAVRRRGKYLWFAFDDGDALIAHLGMSGQFRVHAADDELHPHTRVRFDLGVLELRFVDQRMFGGFTIVPEGSDDPVPHIALDPFDPAFDPEAVARRLVAKRSTVKRALLDQRLVSGVGNIYADETLWRARLHHETPTNALDIVRAAGVLSTARDVMAEALAQGGTSFDSLYVNVNGESGYFDRSLAVYGRENDPCPRCGTPIVRDHFMNRSSHYCPTCQRGSAAVRAS